MSSTLTHLKLKEGDTEYINVKRFLEECNKYTSAVEIKQCLVKNYLRFGFKSLLDFDPQLKLNKDLDVIFSGNEEDLLQRCSGGKRIIYKLIDIFVSYILLKI